MRRAVARLVQAGALQCGAEAAPAQAAAGMSQQLVRNMSAGPAPETPLTKIMPPLVTLPRQVVTTALNLTGKLLVGAATSGPAKSAVTSFAEGVLLKEQFVKLNELDVAYWTYWLSTCGYSAQGGYKRLATAAVEKLPSMEAAQVADLVVGFHTANYYDKSLFDAISTHVSAHFTKYETADLLKMLAAFQAFGHYSPAVFDDIADSITYCNHYLAPVKVPTNEVCTALAAFAKFGHERGDVFVTLARGISELGLSKLDKQTRAAAVVDALTAFHKFNFYPEQVDALLYFTMTEADAFSGDALRTAETVKKAVESQTGGKLDVYTPNADEDAAHWYGHHAHHAPAHHELYVFREALVPKSYSPAALRRGRK